jgi:hypothetical protein
MLPTFVSFKVSIAHGSFIISPLATHVHSHPLPPSIRYPFVFFHPRLSANLFRTGFWHSVALVRGIAELPHLQVERLWSLAYHVDEIYN